MEEFDEYAKSVDIKESSIATYRNDYKRLIAILNKSVRTSSQKSIMDKINELDVSPNSKNNMFKIALIIRKFYNKPTTKLEKNNSKNQNDLDDFNVNKKEELAKSLPSSEDINNYLEELKNDENKIVEYIVNYLIINFNTRNKDLNVVITKLKSISNKPNDNYLYINTKKKQVEYIRNNYKTEDTYGKKINIIKDMDFINKINLLKQKYLLETKDKKRISPVSLNKVISRMTLNNLGTGNYFKIMSSSVDKKDLKMLSKNRGTSINTIIAHYIV